MAYAQIALKLLAGLFCLIVITRLLGKKSMSQLTPFDFVYAIILGSILEEGIYDQTVPLTQILFGFAVWGCAIFTVEKLAQKNRFFRNLLKGNPALIIENGQINVKELQKNNMDLEQMQTMLRKQGIFSLKEVRDLYLEPGGDISVKTYERFEPLTPEQLGIKPRASAPAVLLVEEGVIKQESLEAIQKTRTWLYDQLAKEGYPATKEILYAEWSETGGFYIQPYSSAKQQKKDPGQGSF